jgi:hypothetical protein
MRTRITILGNVLVGAGAAIGVATVAAIATGYQIRLTPEMIQLLTYKALGAAAIGLMIAGTWIGRGGSKKNSDALESSHGGSNALSEPAEPVLPEGASVKMNAEPGEVRNAKR